METKNDEVPLSQRRLKVGIIFNSKKGVHAKAADAEAEYDNPETVAAITQALSRAGYEVTALEADGTLAQSVKSSGIDIAFNIAEGLRGRGREAEVPALLTMLDIPYTGSDETALAVSLDKEMCKRLLSTYGVPVPASSVADGLESLDQLNLTYPLIIKPNAEGSSKGVSDTCVVRNPQELRAMLEQDLELYGEPMLCEEYLPGREFTVGILGNGKTARVFPPMEIEFRGNTQGDYKVYSYNVKQDYQKYVSYHCPADITPQQAQAMENAALTAFAALGCRDFARVDFRMDAEGTPRFIEINPLPGLAPGYSDYPMLAAFSGVEYETLVCSVLQSALRRLGMEAAK